jgi:hypothetical protein
MNKRDAQIDWSAMPPWLEKIIQSIDIQLNWLDFVFFGLGLFVLGIVVFVIFRKKKRIHVEEIAAICETYENDIHRIKRRHLEEIEKAEKSIFAFKKRLGEIEADYEESLKEQERSYLKRVQNIEKGYSKIHATDEITMYELKNEIQRLRTKQVDEVETFEGEIKRLKEEIKGLHERHTKQIEMSEMQISDLRKQMRALMYRV